jgi:hypothetical protein
MELAECAPAPPPPPLTPTNPASFLADGTFVLDGPIDGGTEITFIGGNDTLGPLDYVDTDCDDSFTGAVIDATKWTTAVTGSGTAVQNNELSLRTGVTVNSSAELRSFGTFDVVSDLRVDFRISTDLDLHVPASTVRFFDFELFVDANNYFRVSRVFDTTIPARHAFRITCVIGGSTVDNLVVLTAPTSGCLRLVRVKNRVIVYFNSMVMYDSNPFLSATRAQAIFRVINPSGVNQYDFTTIIDNFAVATMVLFGEEPGAVKRLGETFIRVESPAVPTPRTVAVAVYTCAGLLFRILDAFDYELTTQFKVLSVGTVTAGILNDRTLRNLAGGRLGFVS